MHALRRVGQFAAIVAALATASGCTKSSVKVDGSSTVYLISEAVAEEFRTEHPEVRVTVGLSGTGGGMKKFSAGELDICDASRPIKEEEKKACAEHGVEYIELEIAFDGLSIVVNPANNWCDCLTVEQLKAMWQPESAVKKWSDINPDWPDEKIELFGPGTDSGTFEYFTEAIVGKAKSSRNDYSPSEDDNMLVVGVEGNKHALGYFGYAYYEENKAKLKLVGVNAGDGCVLPSPATVRNHTYKPLSRPLFIYVRKSSLSKPAVVQFIDFYLAHVGELVTQVGYVPVTDEIALRDKQLWEETKASMAAKP